MGAALPQVSTVGRSCSVFCQHPAHAVLLKAPLAEVVYSSIQVRGSIVHSTQTHQGLRSMPSRPVGRLLGALALRATKWLQHYIACLCK